MGLVIKAEARAALHSSTFMFIPKNYNWSHLKMEICKFDSVALCKHCIGTQKILYTVYLYWCFYLKSHKTLGWKHLMTNTIWTGPTCVHCGDKNADFLWVYCIVKQTEVQPWYYFQYGLPLFEIELDFNGFTPCSLVQWFLAGSVAGAADCGRIFFVIIDIVIDEAMLHLPWSATSSGQIREYSEGLLKESCNGPAGVTLCMLELA